MDNTIESTAVTNDSTEPNIPFFATNASDDGSSISDSSTVTLPSRWDSLLGKSIGKFIKPSPRDQDEKLQLVLLRDSMQAWSAHKPSTETDTLPYNDVLIANNPFLNLSPFESSCETLFSNFIALLSNSIRREIADMEILILPGVLERSTADVSKRECSDLESWWNGFAEYLCCVLSTVATVLELQNSQVASDISELPNVKRRDINREYARCIERLTVTSEIPMKEMTKKLRALLDMPSRCRVISIENMWSCLSIFVLQTLDDSFNVAKFIEFTTKKELGAGKQKKILRDMLSPPRPMQDKDVPQYHADILISMTRWMKDEKAVVEFIERYFKKKVVQKLDMYITLYARRRGIFEYQYRKRPEKEPEKKPHMPSRVKFSLSE